MQTVLAGFNVDNPIGVITTSTGFSVPGSMSVGDYQYVVTYVSLFGETHPSAASASEFSNGSMNLSNIPTSDNHEVIAKKLYRSLVDDFSNFYYLATISSRTTTYLDLIADANLGDEVPDTNTASSSQICNGVVGFSKPIVYSTSNITAAGSTAASATVLTTENSYVNVPVDLNGVILPPISAVIIGQRFIVANNSATNRLKIYPSQLNESVGGGSAGVPYVLDAVTTRSFIAADINTWSIFANPGAALSPGLVSIGNLVTSGNEIIYTTATNIYATTSISPAGRSFISASNITEQQSALNLEVGIDVQAYSANLASLSAIGNLGAGQIAYTTGAGYSNTALSSYVRTSVLACTDATAFRSAINLAYLPADTNGGFNLSSDNVVGRTTAMTLTNKTISTGAGGNIITLGAGTSLSGIPFSTAGSTSEGNILTVVGGTLRLQAPVAAGDVTGPNACTDNAIVRFDTTTGKLIQNSGVLISDTNNITGVLGLNATTLNATTLVASNITGVINTAAQPNITLVGALTSLAVTGASVLSGGATVHGGVVPTGHTLTLIDSPVAGTDATNKAYVDALVSTGAAPLLAASAASTTVLPNTPVYSSAAGTLTATGAVIALTIDGVSITANSGQRILIKNQVDPRQNGVYTRTANSGGNWQLTRTTDFNTPPIIALTTIFTSSGSVNINTTWSLQATVTQFNPQLATPGSSDVIWVQISGSQNLQPGTGMTQTGNMFNVNGTANRILANFTSIDIDPGYIGQTSLTTLGTVTTGSWNGSPVGVTYGGTGLVDPVANNVLVTNGSSAFTTKINPSGAFVGTTDTQTITNKIIDAGRINTATSVFANSNVTASTLTLNTSALTTTRILSVPDATDTLALLATAQTFTNKTMTGTTNNLIARALWTNSGTNSVSTYASPNPTSGQVLTATGASAATWQTLPATGFNPSRTLFVYKTAPNVSPNWSSFTAALADAVTMTPTDINPVLIQVLPGLYSEVNPITVPAFVTITSLTGAMGDVTLRPAAPAIASPMLITAGNTRLNGFIVENHDGSGGFATVGIYSSGVAGLIDLFVSMVSSNASQSCFQIVGGGTKYSHFVLYKFCVAQVTIPGLTVTSGFDCSAGGSISGVDVTATGFLIFGFTGILTNGVYVRGDTSTADMNTLSVSFCTNGVRCGGGTTSNSQSEYPYIKCTGATVSNISGVSLLMEEKSVVTISAFNTDDSTGLYPNQLHLTINSPALPAEPNVLQMMSVLSRSDKVSFGGAGVVNNPPRLIGFGISDIPGNPLNRFQGGVCVGSPVAQADFSAGEGGAHGMGLRVLVATSLGAFTDITNSVNAPVKDPIAVNVASVAAIDLASAPSTIDGAVLTSGITRVLVKDGSSVTPGTTSVDNGIYIWNGTGVAMTRSSDFAAASRRNFNTWFMVDTGTVNYGSAWKIDAATLALTTTVIVGTTAWGVVAQSAKMFPATPAIGDAFYIGSNLLMKFPGTLMSMIKPITTSSGSSTGVVTWEYWNGSAWVTLNFMSTLATAPYTNRADKSLAFGLVITNPNTIGLNQRFGNINSTWATTTINGTLAYWMRIRIINAVLITQVPTVTWVRLHSNFARVGPDGYVEYFGTARPRTTEPIQLGTMFNGGIETPTSQRLIGVTSPAIISITPLYDVFANNVTASLSSVWKPPMETDSSSNLFVRVSGSISTPAGGNFVMQINYAFIVANDVIGNTTGTTTAIGKTAVNFVFASPSTVQGAYNITIPVNISGLDPTIHTVWLKLSRLGADAADTATAALYIHAVTFSTVKWSAGEYYS